MIDCINNNHFQFYQSGFFAGFISGFFIPPLLYIMTRTKKDIEKSNAKKIFELQEQNFKNQNKKECKCDEIKDQIDLLYGLLASFEIKLNTLEEKIDKINKSCFSPLSLETPKPSNFTPSPKNMSIDSIQPLPLDNEPSDDEEMTNIEEIEKDINKAHEQKELDKKYWIF